MESVATECPLQPLVERLNDQYPGWQIWIAAVGGFVVQLPNRINSFHGGTLSEVLNKATEFVDLPRIPRRPLRRRIEDYTAVRRGSKWTLIERGQEIVFNQPSRKSCIDFAAGQVEQNKFRVEQWEQEYGIQISGKQEGIDFVWSD